MTCADIINIVDNTRTNRVNAELKLMWINNLDRKIQAELMPDVQYSEHLISDSVLADDPEIYVAYLLAQMDFYIGEHERYNNEYLKFAQLYQDYGATYIRTHSQKGLKIKW